MGAPWVPCMVCSNAHLGRPPQLWRVKEVHRHRQQSAFSVQQQRRRPTNESSCLSGSLPECGDSTARCCRVGQGPADFTDAFHMASADPTLPGFAEVGSCMSACHARAGHDLSLLSTPTLSGCRLELKPAGPRPRLSQALVAAKRETQQQHSPMTSPPGAAAEMPQTCSRSSSSSDRESK